MGLNNLIKIISIGLTIAVVSSTSHAITISGALDTPRSGIYTYTSTLDHNEEVVYEQSSTEVILDQKINGQKERYTIVTTPGKDANGYSKLAVKKIDEKNVTIEIDRTEYPDNVTPINLKYAVKGTFVQGKWSDMLANKPIQIALTSEAKMFTRSKIKLYLEMFIKSKANEKLATLSAFKQAIVGSFKSAKLVDSEFKFDTTMLAGNKKELKQGFQINTLFNIYN
jgi:hypothetical protein